MKTKVSTQTSQMLIDDRLDRSRCHFIKNFTKLNLFRTRSIDPETVHQQILTTRLFILLFTAALVILLAYTSISERTTTENIKQPSLNTFQQLTRHYPNTLQCPCQQISLFPKHFVKTTPKFHQVCSSDFTKQSWIDFTFEANTRLIYPMDVRTFLSPMWQLIASLCRAATRAIADALIEFYNEPMITFQASSETLLETQIQSRLEDTRQGANEHLKRDLITIQTIGQINGFNTGTMMNFYAVSILFSDFDILPLSVIQLEIIYLASGSNDGCYCYRDQSCPIPAGLYLLNRSVWDTYMNLNVLNSSILVPGMVFNCLPILATFASSLECFYNRSCIDLLQQVYAKAIDVSILNITESSRFLPTTPLGQLIDELFLEEIINSTSFSVYYDQCAPISCTYTYSHRFDRVFIIATLLGLIGGLNTALRLLCPYVIQIMLAIKHKWMTRRQAPLAVNENVNQQGMWQRIWITIKIKVKTLDIFVNDCNYHLTERQGRLATRVYLILMIVLLIILIIHTNQSIQTYTITLQSPSLQQYEYLQHVYPDTHRCPCSNISIPYVDFIQITPTYHQLCSSGFVQPYWYRHLYFLLGYSRSISFLALASSYFRALAFFCSLADDTFTTAYERFLSTTYIHAQVLPRRTFTIQTNQSIERFLETTRSEFLYTISLLNDLLHVDQYASGLESNTYYRMDYVDDQSTPSPYRVYPIFNILNADSAYSCNCGETKDCAVVNNMDVMGFMPTGISIRCSMLDTVLKSSLTCWFDEECFDILFSIMLVHNPNLPTNISILIGDVRSRFSLNSTLEDIVNELMVESYNISMVYETYYAKCSPSLCTFTYKEKSNLVYIVTTIIGLFGGLNVSLRLIIPLIVKLFFRRRRNAIRPAVTIIVNNPEIESMHRKVFSRFQRLNLFATGSTDINTLRYERLSTRIYFLLILVSITIIIIYTVVPSNVISKTIESPSPSQYEQLVDKHGSSLDCPCKQISIPYQDLLTIQTTYHQICSSDFVDPAWISSISYTGNQSLLEIHADFRLILAVYFRMLSALCTRAKSAVDKAINELLTRTIQTSTITSNEAFLSRMHDLTSQFKQSASSEFSRMIQMLRDYLHGNTFMSSYDLNWYFWSDVIINGGRLWNSPIIFNDSCSCGTRSDCFSSQPFDSVLPGLVLSCSIIEGVMRSTLISLYNQTLLENLNNYVSDALVKSLNRTLINRFQVDTSVQEMVNELFVEDWYFNVSYSAFYDICAPLYCTYLITERNNALFIVSYVLGLYGGLSVTFWLVAPWIAHLYYRWIAFIINRRART